MHVRWSDPSFADLRRAIEHSSARVERISHWSVGQHIHHCNLAARAICLGLAKSRPPAPRSWRMLLAFWVLRRGRLPRGRARAPQSTLPSALRAEELRTGLDELELECADIRRLRFDAWIAHPVLGALTRERALRFIAVHNRHHITIIGEILRGMGDSPIAD